MGVTFYLQNLATKFFKKFKSIHFSQDSSLRKAWRDKKKAKLVSDKSKVSIFNEKFKSCRQQAINTVENSSIEIPIPLPTELFGPIHKIPLYLIN